MGRVMREADELGECENGKTADKCRETQHRQSCVENLLLWPMAGDEVPMSPCYGMVSKMEEVDVVDMEVYGYFKVGTHQSIFHFNLYSAVVNNIWFNDKTLPPPRCETWGRKA